MQNLSGNFYHSYHNLSDHFCLGPSDHPYLGPGVSYYNCGLSAASQSSWWSLVWMCAVVVEEGASWRPPEALPEIIVRFSFKLKL